MRKLLTILFTLSFFISFSQEKILKGIVKDNFSLIQDAHIVNLTTKKGAITNHKGEFSIPANINDSILVSSLAHEVHKFKVSKLMLNAKENIIKLLAKNNMLDEVTIKKTALTGNLISDIKKTPKNYGEELSLNIFLNYKELAKQIKIPTKGLIISLGANAGKKRKAKRKRLKEKIQFPNKIIKYYGSYFFTEELKIPEEKIHNFIDYCMSKNIFNLYKNNQLFELTQVLFDESKTYLALNTTNK